MKFFKSLLVAPATLGLLAPMSATANEVTISDFAPAEQLAVTNSRVDGLEARLKSLIVIWFAVAAKGASKPNVAGATSKLLKSFIKFLTQNIFLIIAKVY